MRLFCAIILSLSLLSCGKTKETATTSDTLITSTPDSTKAGKFDYDAQFKLENYLAEQTDTSKVQTIAFDCAVIIYPSPDQIEEMEKAEGEENFATIADDASFYQSQASQIIDSVGIKTVMANKPFLKFTGSKKNWTLDIRKKNLPAWNLILFNKNKSPLVSPTISLTSEMVRTYFDKK